MTKKHEMVDGTLYFSAQGIYAQCTCGWVSGVKHTATSATIAMQDHVEDWAKVAAAHRRDKAKLEGADLEMAYWTCTNQLRWHRFKGANDTQLVLEQLWERMTGERRWKVVPTLLDD